MGVRDEHIEIFDAYMRGGMSTEEVRDFENRLLSDPDWAAAFQEYRQLAAGVRNHFSDELKLELKAIDREMDREMASTAGTRFRKLAWVSGGIAATLLLALFAYAIFGTADHAKLANQYWPVEEGLPVKMSAKNKYDAAMNAFKFEDWQVAEQQLNALPESDTTAYFLGNVYFKQARFDKAATQFKPILEPSPWHGEAQFRLALALLAQEKTAESQALLQNIAASDSPFSADAEAVLEEL